MYRPAGYSDSDSDSGDDLYEPSRTTEVAGRSSDAVVPAEKSWISGAIGKSSPDQDFDSDIKEILETGDVEVVEELLDEVGVEVDRPLASAYGWSLALYVTSRADHKLLSFLLERGGTLRSVGPEPCSGFLVLATVDPRTTPEEDIIKTAQIVLATGEDPNLFQSQRKTPLMLASSLGNLVLVELLCRNGALLDVKDTQGWSALMFAADGGHGAVVRTLLEEGADPDLISVDGVTAADLAAQHSNPTLQRIIEGFSARRGLSLETGPAPVKARRRRELDNILVGLDLEHYKEVFDKHEVGIEEFLTLSEADLVEMGIDKVGARKRILEGQVETHKKNWSNSSMPTLTFSEKQTGLRITCPEVAGILGNLNNHLTFLKATIVYIRLQVRNHGPRLLQAGSDLVPPSQLLHMTETSCGGIGALERECGLLCQELELVGAGDSSHTPVDALVQPDTGVSFQTILLISALPLMALGFFKFS